MQQLLSVWSALEPQRRIVVIGATVLVFIAVLALGRMATKPGMALLYAGLEQGAAGEVVQALQQRSDIYEVRGDAIYVAQRARDEIRMTLAGQGLPATGAQGYELLDGLSGFGTTSQMFDAAYLRAKEGELARTIVASPHIRAARVHIALANQQPFRREVAPTASVTVTPVVGGLPPGQARALRFLVSSAVAGLSAEDVSVIDGVGGHVLMADEPGPAPSDGADRGTELRRAVERLLEAHVGPGRAVVEVSVETVTERESIIERRLDPESRVAVLTDTEERSSTSTDSAAAGVSVASNLPDGDAAADESRSQSQNAESRERLTYDVSETARELHRPPGAIRRLSVAVMIDGLREPDVDGVLQWRPRSDGELEHLHELVASAVGFDAARGDVITLKSLQFEPVTAPGTSAGEASLLDRLELDLMALVQLVVLALVTLALILFVIRPVLASGTRRAPARIADGSAPSGRAELSAPAGSLAPAVGVPGIGDMGQDPADGPPPLPALPAIADFGGAAGFGLGDGPSGRSDSDAVARLRRLIDERQDETVEILRSWMEDGDEENA